MVVAVCKMTLSLPAAVSLKDKRSVIKPILARLRSEFNVSVAEVENQDQVNTATLAAATISTDAAYSHGLLEKVVKMVERSHWEAVVEDYTIEVL
jgi:hypothetical protein